MADTIEIKCGLCGRELSVSEDVKWEPLFTEEESDECASVMGIKVYIECPCGNTCGYVDLFDEDPSLEDL